MSRFVKSTDGLFHRTFELERLKAVQEQIERGSPVDLSPELALAVPILIDELKLSLDRLEGRKNR